MALRLRVVAIAAVLLLAGAALAAEAGAEKDFPFERSQVGVDLGGGRRLAVPGYFLVILLFAFVAFGGILVRRILRLEAEKGTCRGAPRLLVLWQQCAAAVVCGACSEAFGRWRVAVETARGS
jgi:hypothetical protein